MAIWDWLRDEHNRAIIIMIGTGIAAIVVAGWAIFTYLRRKPESVTTSNTNASTADRGGLAARDIHNSAITITPPAEPKSPHPDIQAITDKAMEEARRTGALSQRVNDLEQDNQQLRAKLTAALERTEARAEAGDPQARAAIEQARTTGDLSQLDAALDAEFARREDEIKQQAADWFELCRESAAIAYLRGDIDKAQNRLETILRFFPGDVDATNRLGHIHGLCGRLPEAEAAYRRVLELAPNESWQAAAFGNLGVIHQTRGDLDEAEQMFRKALVINEKLGRLEGMADQYGNLGNVYSIRGDFDEAETMYRRSLEIDEKLGRLEGMAIAYGNLGIIMRTCGDLDEAEKMHRKSLAINEQLGRLEGMAIAYGNLGNVRFTCGDLDEAEMMYRRSLEIDEQLGRLEGMANAYANLGLLAAHRGNLVEARRLLINSRDLFAQLGAKHMVEQMQGWLDSLPE